MLNAKHARFFLAFFLNLIAISGGADDSPFKKFQFIFEGKPARGSYLQSAEMVISSPPQDVRGKINVFLLPEDKFVLEYTEIRNREKVAPVAGEFNGVVIQGGCRLEKGSLVLLRDGAEIGTLVTQKSGLRFTLNADLHDFEKSLWIRKLEKPVTLNFHKTSRSLAPVAKLPLYDRLASEMAASRDLERLLKAQQPNIDVKQEFKD